jgi:hypothetical protein
MLGCKEVHERKENALRAMEKAKVHAGKMACDGM